jgi:hypothetical protein
MIFQHDFRLANRSPCQSANTNKINAPITILPATTNIGGISCTAILVSRKAEPNITTNAIKKHQSSNRVVGMVIIIMNS